MTATSVLSILNDDHKIDSTVCIKGWVRTRRDSKAGISFLSVYDASCFEALQAVIPATAANYTSEVLKITTGCAVAITGRLIHSQGKGQKYELADATVEVFGFVKDPDSYPLAAKRHSIEYLREVAHLRPRSNLIGAVARVRSCLSQAIHRFFAEQGYLWVATPIITASDCEGAGEMLQVSTLDWMNQDVAKPDYSQDFFGKKTFLTVSGQLNAEAYACALKKVYTFGPTFRAENSNTSRHLAEFWMVEPELAFADLDAVAVLAEQLLKYCFKAVLAACPSDMEFFAQRVNKEVITRLEKVITSDFHSIDYTDAIEILLAANKKFENKVEWGVDLSSEHERYLAEQHFQAPVIVKNYPKAIKAFYMRANADGKTVAAMDVLAPGIGEIIGGAQREERLEVLEAKFAEVGLCAEEYSWYLDLRRYGTVPHAGFGLGFERLVSYVTGVSNVRDVIPFPRTVKSANF